MPWVTAWVLCNSTLDPQTIAPSGEVTPMRRALVPDEIASVSSRFRFGTAPAWPPRSAGGSGVRLGLAFGRVAMGARDRR